MRGSALAMVCALAAACAGSRALEADRAYEAGLARVERLDVRVTRELPTSVHVDAIGVLPDSCTEIDRARQERGGASVSVTLTTRREARAACVEEPRPFRYGVLLDVGGLPAGLYFVDVNGVRETFQIQEDLGARERLDRYRWP